MLSACPVNGFLRVTNPERARHFYEQVLGLTFEYENPYVIVFRSGETMIIAQRVKEFVPIASTVLGWEVKDIDAMVAFLVGRGVAFVKYPHLDQDALGIWNSPAGKVAWFKDPDGNVLSVSEH